MFTNYAQSLAYVALCIAVWGAGEGIGAFWDRTAIRWARRYGPSGSHVDHR